MDKRSAGDDHHRVMAGMWRMMLRILMTSRLIWATVMRVKRTDRIVEAVR